MHFFHNIVIIIECMMNIISSGEEKRNIKFFDGMATWQKGKSFNCHNMSIEHCIFFKPANVSVYIIASNSNIITKALRYDDNQIFRGSAFYTSSPSVQLWGLSVNLIWLDGWCSWWINNFISSYSEWIGVNSQRKLKVTFIWNLHYLHSSLFCCFL